MNFINEAIRRHHYRHSKCILLWAHHVHIHIANIVVCPCHYTMMMWLGYTNVCEQSYYDLISYFIHLPWSWLKTILCISLGLIILWSNSNSLIISTKMSRPTGHFFSISFFQTILAVIYSISQWPKDVALKNEHILIALKHDKNCFKLFSSIQWLIWLKNRW